MAEVSLPHEVKRMIYDLLDLKAVKSLRLVSKSWAAVGVELLFLPIFVVKSPSIDILRLIDIGARPDIAEQAAKTIKTLSFRTTGWDPEYLRTVLCSRHVHVRQFEVVAFVPNRVEMNAMAELDDYIVRRKADDVQCQNRGSLIQALRVIPQVCTLEFENRNPFENILLRKVWDEFTVDISLQSSVLLGCRQLLGFISAAKEAGLVIRHFHHEMLSSTFFWNENQVPPPEGIDYLHQLQTLHVQVYDCDYFESAQTVEAVGTSIRNIISESTCLRDLAVRFFELRLGELNCLPETTKSNLVSLTLYHAQFETKNLMRFLQGQAATLKNLHLNLLDDAHLPLKDFAEKIRDLCGFQLERVQITGYFENVGNLDAKWLLLPIYSKNWEDLVDPRRSRTKLVEDFILRGAPWPTTPVEIVA